MGLRKMAPLAPFWRSLLEITSSGERHEFGGARAALPNLFSHFFYPPQSMAVFWEYPWIFRLIPLSHVIAQTLLLQQALLLHTTTLQPLYFSREISHFSSIWSAVSKETPGRQKRSPDAQTPDPILQQLADHFDLSISDFYFCRQTHSSHVHILDQRTEAFSQPQADGLVTALPRFACVIRTADCAPVLLADRKKAIVAAIHAGWRGALDGIMGQAVMQMQKLGSNLQDICAAIGPLIRQPNYEVGPEFVQQFLAQNADFADFFAPASRPDHFLFDLARFLHHDLQRNGIHSIDDIGLDTYSQEEQFHSYRRQCHKQSPCPDRQLSIIVQIE